MALSDLAVFSEYAYSGMTELLDQQIQLFNGASAGTITLVSQAHQGDFSERAFYKRINGLVRRRNPYGSGAVPSKKLEHLIDNMVKVAAGTPPIELDPGQFRWIQRNPQEAGAAMGQQLAMDTLADMLNTAVGVVQRAISTVPALNLDVTAEPTPTLTFQNMTKGAALFGDRSDAVRAWIMHSGPMTDLYLGAINNNERLFNYGTVNVMRDPFGRVYLVTDSSQLMEVNGGGDTDYFTLGLTPSAVEVHTNGDFTDNTATTNGDENIQRTYQAEWSYNLGVKGFAWDKTAGGKAPDDAALMTAANWLKIMSSNKDLAGVCIKSQ